MDERERPRFGPQPDCEAGKYPYPEWPQDEAWLGSGMATTYDGNPESWDLDETWDSDGEPDPDEAWDSDEAWHPGVGLRFGQGDEADSASCSPADRGAGRRSPCCRPETTSSSCGSPGHFPCLPPTSPATC